MANQHELKNGLLLVLAESAGGIYNGEQLKKVCEVAQDDSVILKITEDQRLAFMLEPSRLDSVKASLELCGVHLRLYRAPGAPAPKACMGELCPHSVQDSLGDSIELGAMLAEKYASAPAFVRIGVNGCERACVGSAIDDIHIVGEESGYKIAIAGRSAEIPQLGQYLIDNVSKENLCEVVCRVLDAYYAKREGEESFLDVVEREGMSVFTAAAEGQVLETDEAPVVEAADEAVVEEMVSDEIPVADLAMDDGIDSVTSENSEELLADEELDVPMDIDVETSQAPDLELSVDMDVDIDAVAESKPEEQLTEISDGEFDQAVAEDPVLDVGASEEELVMDEGSDSVLTESVSEVDVDAELAGVVETQQTMAEVNGDLQLDTDLELVDDVELVAGDKSNLVDLNEHLEQASKAVSASISEQDSIAFEEPSVTFEEAGADDVGRMTAALHSEASAASSLETQSRKTSVAEIVPEELAVESIEELAPPPVDMELMEEESIPLTSALDDFDAENAKNDEVSAGTNTDDSNNVEPLLAPKDLSKPASRPVQAPKPKGRLRLKMGEHELKIVLPNGIECAVPMGWVEENGVFEMDVGNSALSVEKQGDSLIIRYGELVLSVPTMAENNAA